jgi:hypothetical protein
MDELEVHAAVQELLGAYALDAVEPDEAELIKEHLSACARCRAEVAEHREVASLLAYPGVPAPDGLWDRIAGRLHEAPAVLPLDRFQPRPDAAGPAGVRPIGFRRQTLQRRVLIAVAAVAAAAIAVLGIQVARLDRRTSRLPAAWSAQAKQTAFQVALANPGARRATLISPDRTGWMQAVILPDGTSYLGPTNLPSLATDETYQLWGVVGGDRVSLGVVGSKPAYQAFSTPASVSALAMTVERAGGVVAPTKTPVVATTLAHA